MDRHSVFRWGLIITSLVILYLSYLVVEPFMITLILAFITSFIFYPIFKFFNKKCNKQLSSTLILVLVLLLLIVPSSLLVTKLVTEASATYRSFLDADIQLEQIPIINNLPFELPLEQGDTAINAILSGVRDYLVSSSPNVLGGVASAILHLFIFFFVLFFTNMHGSSWYKNLRNTIPLRSEVKKHLFDDLEKVVNGMVYGQFLTAVIQGTAGGLMFFVFGIPNPIFWGFIMILFSFLPLLGTPLIFIPAGVIQLLQGEYISGFGVLIVGFVLIMNLDNFVRPYLVNRFTEIHPVIVLIGVLGGLQAFGFAGMVLGPLVLALLLTLIKDFSSHKELLVK